MSPASLQLLAVAVVVAFVAVTVPAQPSANTGGNKCYDEFNRPQRCIPEFENPAVGLTVEVTNICGQNGDTEFCVQTGSSGSITNKTCDVCNPTTHSPTDMTDLNALTWWQSDTMVQNIQYPNQVNLTLNFGKAFDITYIILLFKSPRPESFAIYKKTTENGPWIPYQFYSSSCRDTYGLSDMVYIRTNVRSNQSEQETRAFCTSEFSDISPLSGGNVPFSTLENRPSARYYDYKPELQEWVTATDIRITLDRLNTFGDEVYGNPQVLKSYFYAIAEITVGARCKCNGHADACEKTIDGRRICECKHNTAGPDCNECLPYYNDVPWSRATSSNANECKECNCNGFSDICYFDKDLYEQTGHGGHCLNCNGNRDGANCERCRENYYQRKGDAYCSSCECNEIGSRSLQCNAEGKCQCRDGVIGDKCDRCAENHYEFSSTGCKPCGCNEAGSLDNQPRCDAESGNCICKENVEGIQCNRCKPGFFNLNNDNEYGCTPCFCYGHSSVCQSASGYSRISIESRFVRSNERWNGTDQYGRTVLPVHSSHKKSLEISSQSKGALYFSAPAKFLGDQRPSYNHDLTFKLSIGENSPEYNKIRNINDVILESGSGIQITQAIVGQGNELPSDTPKMYKFRLHENPDYGWYPRLSSRDFFSVLSNLTAIKIRGTYNDRGVGFLDDFSLQTAKRGSSGLAANWVELCTCPKEYIGQFCESCAPGYRHESSSGDPLSPCIPCNCHGHATICDAESGRCICQHNTAGENCDRCAKGYYGNALQGTALDCKPCPCPNQGSCFLIDEDTVVCSECPEGYGGIKCEICSDGYFGDPTGKNGPIKMCQPCDCNNNVDPNAIGNCDRITGECIKCIYNTTGPQCDQCLSGYFGNALNPTEKECKSCDCHQLGTTETNLGPLVCDPLNGKCQCKPHVIGVQCDQCEIGYFNIASGDGCQSCECDSVGSVNNTCDTNTGQCFCHPGITGKKCDTCEQFHYGFSVEGCKPCDCDPVGSKYLLCDADGQCPCFENVEGRQCDQCKENKHNLQLGCVDCPACYNLVQDAVNNHRKYLEQLEKVLRDINKNNSVINDKDFEQKLKEVQLYVNELETITKYATDEGNILTSDKLQSLRDEIDKIQYLKNQMNEWTANAKDISMQAETNITNIKYIIDNTTNILRRTSDFIQTDGATTLEKARKKSDEIGQQSKQMTDIAREARQYVDEKESEIKQINDAVEKAKNISTEAYEIINLAFHQQKNISEELKGLDTELNFVEKEKLGPIIRESNEIQETVSKIENDTLSLYRDIFAINMPDINVTSLKLNISDLKTEVDEIKNNLDLQTNSEALRNLLNEVDKELQQSNDTLQRSEELQKKIENFMADANASYEKAGQAVEFGGKIIKEANQTLAILEDYDQQVQLSKNKADEALKQVPEIQKLIDDASNITLSANKTLARVNSSAIIARDVARLAQDLYTVQANEAKQLKNSTYVLLEEVIKLNNESDGMKKRIEFTTGRLEEAESQCEKDKKSIIEAKAIISQSNTTASEAKQIVDKVLKDIEDIKNELSNLVDVDSKDSSDTLMELSDKLKTVEQELEKADLEAKINAINNAKFSQINKMKEYDELLNALINDVNNLDAINESLPNKCWKLGPKNEQ